MNNNCIFQNRKMKLVGRVALCFYIFANLLNGWLNRRQLAPQICCCIYCVKVSHIM